MYILSRLSLIIKKKYVEEFKYALKMFSAIHRSKFLFSRLIYLFVFEKLTQIERKFNITLQYLLSQS